MNPAIESFFNNHSWDLLKKLNGWKINKRNDYLIEFELPAKDGEKYKVLFDCNGYPDIAPGVVFVNCEGSALDPKAWPKGSTAFHNVVKPPPNCFLCIPITKEGLHHHKEWIGSPSAWNPSKHSLMNVINYIHRLLNSPDYIGRGD